MVAKRKGVYGGAEAKGRVIVGRKSPEKNKNKPKAAAKSRPSLTKRTLVDLNEFEDLVDLVNAWMKMKGKVKGESSRDSPSKREPSGAKQSGAKGEPKAKREPSIKRELVNEIMKLGIIDLTEGESLARPANRRQPGSGASPPKGRSPLSVKQSRQAQASSPKEVARRTAAAKFLGQKRNSGKATPKRQPANQKSPPARLPQGLKSLNKLARTCDPQKLWTILQAAARGTEANSSIGAALRAARGRQA